MDCPRAAAKRRLEQATTEGALAYRSGAGEGACPYVERSSYPWIASEAARREAWLQGYRFAARQAEWVLSPRQGAAL